MTIESEIELLERLASLDAELTLLEEDLGHNNAGVSQKRERLTELGGRIGASGAAISEMERTRSDLLIEVRQMGVQVDRSREKLARCRNEKESLAVQRELEELRRLVRDREVELEKLALLIEQARGEMASSEAEQDKLKEEIGTSEGPALALCKELESRRDELQKDRKGIVAGIKPATLSRYELIRKRRGTALAHTSDGTCSACHIALPPMQFQVLMRRERLEQCPQCNRILYFKPAVVSVDDASGAA